MVLDIHPSYLLDQFPHYFEETIFGLRGIHFQEMIDYLLSEGYSCTLIEKRAFEQDSLEVDLPPDRFQNHIDASVGVLVGFNERNKCHATANDHGRILDPVIKPSKMEYFQYWRVDCIL